MFAERCENVCFLRGGIIILIMMNLRRKITEIRYRFGYFGNLTATDPFLRVPLKSITKNL